MTPEQEAILARVRERRRKAEAEEAMASMTPEQKEIIARVRARRLGVESGQQSSESVGRIPDPFQGKGLANVNPEYEGQALQQLGELASSANEAVMWIPDTATKALNLIPGVNLPIPSEAIESAVPDSIDGGKRPGEGGFLPEGLDKEMYRAGGNAVAFGMGATPVQGRKVASKVADAVADFAGFGSAAPAQIAGQVIPDSPQLPAVSGPSKKASRDVAVKSQSGNEVAAGFKLDEAGRVVKDKAQQEAIKSGVDKGIVAYLAAAPKATRKGLIRMLDAVEGGLENRLKKTQFRPADVVGEALEDRVKVLATEARKWGQEVNKTAKALKGKRVDFAPAVDQFLADMAEKGVKVDVNTGTVDFMGSEFEGTADGMKAAQKIIRDTVRRMRYTAQNPDAWDIHRFKKWIDNQVTYGQDKAEAIGAAERSIKGLRHNIDDALDSTFDAYRVANEQFVKAITPIRELQDLAGKRVDIKEARDLGILSRKALSNYSTGSPLARNFEDIDAAAREFMPDLPEGDLTRMITFVSDLDAMYGAGALNSFQGRIEAANRASDAMTMGTGAAAIKWGADKLKGALSKTDKEQVQAMKRLLAEGID